MTPEELAARHPRLYHITEADAWPSIAQRGLLSTRRLLDLEEVEPERRAHLAKRRRPQPVALTHPEHGRVVLNDQGPLSEKALSGCLDDGLAPADWIAILNDRAFFWADQASLDRHQNAWRNHLRPYVILVVDTLSLARAHAGRIEICPINSGSTMRRPARRGLGTFTPLETMDFEMWSRKRGQRDMIREVVVRDGIADIGQHVVEVRSGHAGLGE
jgi:hypothetical protein